MYGIGFEEFKKSCKVAEREVIGLDFDGVIYKNSKGFFDGTIYDEPMEGALDSIEHLSKAGYTLVIYTCKANPSRPLVNNKTGIELVWEWLKLNNVSQYIADVTYIKPNALCYVDDKGIRFNNWQQTINQIEELDGTNVY
tara:strand:- start:863 stop:1282 length:420 start_codon:yes stop_codon:yes gene_type:complete